MSKSETSILKGVAILLMVFLHLFLPRNSGLYDCLITIGGMPFPAILTRLANPVPFFLFLSGYGLFASSMIGGGKNNWTRVLNIYVHLWLIYLIFIPIGTYIRPDFYPGSLPIFLENALSWHCTYIGEQWFLFPYILLMLSSKVIFTFYNKLRAIIVFMLSFSIYLITSIVLKFLGEDTLASYGMLFYNIFLTLYMLFPFTLGVLAYRGRWVEKIKYKVSVWSVKIPLCGLWILMIVCIIKCAIPSSAFDPIYALIFILLFLTIPLKKTSNKIVSYLGKHSMNMWLIHTWICVRLFQPEVYSLRWPILIYVLVILLSLGISIIIEWMFVPFNRFFTSSHFTRSI